MNQFKIFLFLNCILLLTLVSCNQDASGSEIFRDVVIETEDGFRFQDIDWMTNLENMEDDISGAVYNDELARLEVHEELEEVQRISLYYFDENLFTSGEYIILFTNKSDYEKYIDEIKETAESYRSEEHTSEVQSRGHLVCRLLLEKKKLKKTQ